MINFLKYLSYTIFSRRKKSDLAVRVFTFNQRVQGLNFFSNFFSFQEQNGWKKKPFGQVEYLKEKGIFLSGEDKMVAPKW
jgi:hypothetical protein